MESMEGESKDLLHMLLESAKKESGMGGDAINRFIVDNCKDLYLARYETNGSNRLMDAHVAGFVSRMASRST